MFPYAMLATMPVFCYTNWPRCLIGKMPTVLQRWLPSYDVTFQHSEHCIYPEGKKTGEADTDTGRIQDVVKV